jgi:hypothetical protein
MPKAKNTPQPKPWYKNSNNWAWIVSGLCVLGLIIIMILESVEDNRAKSRPKDNRTWYDVMTPEERHKAGLDRKIDGPGDWKPDPNGAQKFREFIEKGGNADPALDAIQDGDYHDLLDQNGGPEGF